jgi:nucleotide-binding universal stress UspA family protein
MDLKDILVCLDPTDAGDTRLRLAAALAREHHAHLSAAYLLTEQIAGAADYDRLGIRSPTAVAEGSLVGGLPAPGTSPAPAGDAARGVALADIIEQRFRETVRPHVIEGDWHMFGAGEARDLVSLAAAVDLVVFGQAAPDYRLPAGFGPGDLLLASGRPMLIIPYAGDFAAIGRRVLVAWDGSREASRALHDALPLLRKAEAVTVVRVRTSERDQDGASLIDRVVRHLQHHGIVALGQETPRGGIPIADVLLSRAADLDADMVVAGAYHHSQLREALLGGVSRDLLDHMTLPVLMSH